MDAGKYTEQNWTLTWSIEMLLKNKTIRKELLANPRYEGGGSKKGQMSDPGQIVGHEKLGRSPADQNAPHNKQILNMSGMRKMKKSVHSCIKLLHYHKKKVQQPTLFL